jgi:hypothetical protein
MGLGSVSSDDRSMPRVGRCEVQATARLFVYGGMGGEAIVLKEFWMTNKMLKRRRGR